MVIIATLVGVAGALYIVLSERDPHLPAVVASLIAAFAVTTNIYFWQRPWDSPSMISMLAAASICVAFLIAMDRSRTVIRSVKDGADRHVSIIYSPTGQTTRAFIVMSGDRGLLLYDPASDRMIFQKADQVSKIDWAR